MDRRYQVFVSATYVDLTEERQHVMQALLELDCIPAGMELFPAADEDQWSLIKRVIDESDYYLVIIAGRYGSLAEDGMSYTQKEYEYAVAQGKPTIAFLHQQPEKLPADRTEQTDKGRKRLQAFRQLAQGKMCKYWTSAGELGSVVSRSLIQLIKRKPGVGWVRADQVVDPRTVEENLKLRRRIERLEKEASITTHAPPDGVDGLAQGEDLFEVNYNYKYQVDSAKTDFGIEYEYDERQDRFAFTWNEIISLVGPNMFGSESEHSVSRPLSEHIGFTNNRPNVSVSGNDVRKIIIQLMALGILTEDSEDRSYPHWTLTPYGRNAVSRLVAIRSTAAPKQEKVI